ncbi:hypothetical protein WJR50_09890 [Catalinimonas sp. 4WD22]|uniref:hypothetical protein n=1 Tax=Catalinimonas locisalis TaxID=3133978 RepID=UPI0031013837
MIWKSIFSSLFSLAYTAAIAQTNTADWFPLQTTDDFSESTIDMSHWLDAPAGKHGFVQSVGGDFIFEDGTPVKFWGVNIASSRPYVEANEAKQWVEYLAKYGVNAVRFHKFSSHALKGETSTQLDTAMFARLDEFSYLLREKGIYYGWSHIYGHKPKAGDSSRLLAYEEIAAVELPWSHLNAATSGLVNFAPDLQQLNIALTVNMLEHTNPHTGLRYADDPALNFIELQNEDNIFWGAIERTLEQTPTYRALLCQQFSDWLRAKYGSHEQLMEAWEGDGLLSDSAHLNKSNLYPKPNHAWFDTYFAEAKESGKSIPQHVQDRASFLYETQLRFYKRFVEAIRETGYRGPIVASCWQAGSGFTHFLNLHADYQTGFIDRHNYFGGGSGHQLHEGEVRYQPMLTEPGSGLLSTGMQQVMDRPFAFSEWMSLLPNEWTAEASPLIAAYGMGLQGWDASYSFASNEPRISSTVQARGHGVYNTDAISQMGLFPALANMIYRKDVQEGALAAVLNVQLEQLKSGEVGFRQEVEQAYDVKSFTGDVPSEALAVGKVAVNFTESEAGASSSNYQAYWDREKQMIQSNTAQLSWSYGEQKYFTINTPGTQGVVGFAQDKNHVLEDINISTDNPFAVIILSSLNPKDNIADADRLLLSTLARSRNTGMRYSADGKKLREVGNSPVLLEPVNLRLELRKRKSARVHVLDHVGSRTGQSFMVEDGQISLDGKQYKTIYYEIEITEQ